MKDEREHNINEHTDTPAADAATATGFPEGKKPGKGFFKKAWKPAVAILVVLGLLGAGGAFLLERHEQSKEQKVKVAETQMIQAEAKSSKVQLLSEQEVKKIVSEKISVPVDKIKFDEIYLETADPHKHKENKAEAPAAETAQTGTTTYVYDVECSANSLKYDLEIDAVNGTIYEVDIED